MRANFRNSVSTEDESGELAPPCFVSSAAGRVVAAGERFGQLEVENEIVIAKGLEKDDRVMLTAPADKDELTLKTLPGVKPVPPQPGAADTPSTAKPVPVRPAPNAAPAPPAAATKS